MSLRQVYHRLTDNVYFQFFYGTAGIYVFAFIASVIHEKLLKNRYHSTSNDREDIFTHPVGLVIFPYLSGWLIGSLIKALTKKDTVEIPMKNLFLCSGAVFTATLTYNIAIVETNYPIVIMVKSCSILSVIVVGVFYSRVRDQKNKLGRSKLVVGALVTVGILLFNLFASSNSAQKSTSFKGIVLLLVSLVADGFLPDFQAEIKTVYKPQPIDLMSQINKWVFLLSMVYAFARFQVTQIILFVLDHPRFAFDLVLMSVMSTMVQIFVYYLIQKFRQHIVPFIITIRKIFSVVISILWFNHSINHIQWLGVIVVFAAAIFDYVWERFFAEKTGHEAVSGLTRIQGDERKAIELDTEEKIETVEEAQDITLSDDRLEYRQEGVK